MISLSVPPFLYLVSLLPFPIVLLSPLPILLRHFLSLLTSFWLLKLLFLLGLCAVAFCIPDEHLFPGTFYFILINRCKLKDFLRKKIFPGSPNTSNARDAHLIPVWGTKNPQALWHSQKKKVGRRPGVMI